MTDYRCKKCDTDVPRGWRMQSCQCGNVWVDWGTDMGKYYVRLLWPKGKMEDWVEEIDREETA